MQKSQDSVSKRTEFNDLVSMCIETGLSDMLGVNAAKAIFFHIKYDKFNGDPEEFSKKLRSLFNTRADLLERVILRELARRLNIRFSEDEATDFNTFVRFASELYKERKT